MRGLLFVACSSVSGRALHAELHFSDPAGGIFGTAKTPGPNLVLAGEEV